jgi:hypothetical protein
MAGNGFGGVLKRLFVTFRVTLEAADWPGGIKMADWRKALALGKLGSLYGAQFISVRGRGDSTSKAKKKTRRVSHGSGSAGNLANCKETLENAA